MSTLPYPPPQQHQRQPEPEPGHARQDHRGGHHGDPRDAPYNPPPAIGVPVTSGAQHYNHSAYNSQIYGPTGMVVVQPAVGPIISQENYWRAGMCGDAECDVVCGACWVPCVVHGSNAKVRRPSRRLRSSLSSRRRRIADVCRPLSSLVRADGRSLINSFSRSPRPPTPPSARSEPAAAADAPHRANRGRV
jgi:hypothetical protein